VDNGSNIPVTNCNDYFEKRIEFLIKRYKPFIEEIKKGLFRVRIYLY
jgi:hypothetical protein